jgi:hypothetical protein
LGPGWKFSLSTSNVVTRPAFRLLNLCSSAAHAVSGIFLVKTRLLLWPC